jgi:hypothetical protein
MTDKKISRRDAMKVLGAAIGAAALANLPSKWDTPELAQGVLPAHARQSNVVVRTLVAGADVSNADFCHFVTSTVAITLPTAGILLRYVVTTSANVIIEAPIPPTGTVATDAAGHASLVVDIDQDNSSNTHVIVTVTWSFENPGDGSGVDSQVFDHPLLGC